MGKVTPKVQPVERTVGYIVELTPREASIVKAFASLGRMHVNAIVREEPRLESAFEGVHGLTLSDLYQALDDAGVVMP